MDDFDRWNKIKKQTNKKFEIKYFKSRQIWWMKLGYNIGHEQNGKGQYFERLVLIITKFNNRIFFGIPLTTKIKNNPFYIKIKDNKNIVRFAIISQLRLLDVSRLRDKAGMINKKDLEEIKKAVKNII